MLTNRTPEAHAWAEKEFKTFRSAGQFIPFSVDKQTVVFPGFDGGAEWGGPAVDLRTGVIYINANDIAWTGGLTENKPGGVGSSIYLSQCALCHGGDRKGSPPSFPTLVDIDKRLTSDAIVDIIHSGKGRMPSFPNVTDTRIEALLTFLKTGRDPISSAAPGGASEPRAARPIQTENRTEVTGARLYQKNCAICHGDDLLGEPSNDPALIGVRSRLGDDAILESIHGGKGRMPAFKKLTDADTSAILRFLGDSTSPIANQDGRSSKQEAESTGASAVPAKYVFTGYRKFLDPDGYPAIVPPWGTLNAIDLNTGKYLWKIPLGEYPELAAKGMKNTGSENYGGPVVTAGGLIIIASTIFDRKIRAFDSKSGQLLWEAELPYAGNATPATYMVDGKQYIVIAASGARDRKGPQGAAYIAFALP